jgi:6-phosphogluconolactonase
VPSAQQQPRAVTTPGRSTQTMALRCVYVAGGGGIVVYHRGEDGALSVHSELELPSGGGAFCVSPNRGYLFVATGGSFETFAIDPASGGLSPCGEPSPPFSDGPAYCTTDRSGRFLLHASYGGHSCAVHAISADGQVGPELQREATSNNSHSVATDPTNRFVYVPCIAQQGDVGTGNAIHGFGFDAATGELTPAGVLVPPKTYPGDGESSRFGTRGELGPRHLTFHPYLPIVYTANEQGNSVSAWTIDRISGSLSHLQTSPTVPEEFAETTHCSESECMPRVLWSLYARQELLAVSCLRTVAYLVD